MIRVAVAAIGLVGPGLPGWVAARAVLRGESPHVWAPPVIPVPSRLPPAERRRVGASVRVALAAAEDAFAGSAIAPAETAAVFASSGGDGENCHVLCEALAAPERILSPTRFTNSVHNAPAGYWSIAAQSRAPSGSLCAFDGSFASGLLEAALQVVTEDRTVVLVAYDVPYPAPLASVRPLGVPFGLALILTAPGGTGALAELAIASYVPEPGAPLADPGLEALRTTIPAARGLPLAGAIAAGRRGRITIDALAGRSLAVEVSA